MVKVPAATAPEEVDVAAVEAEDEALGKPAAQLAEGEASGAMAEATPGVTPGWKPEGLAEEEEDEDFLEVFSLSSEAAAEG